MLRSRIVILSLIAGACFAGGSALAQAQAPAAAPQPSATAKTMDDVSKWTQKQWDAAKAKWVKEKAKWGDCNTKATAQKLSSKASWQFIYDCMTKS